MFEYFGLNKLFSLGDFWTSHLVGSNQHQGMRYSTTLPREDLPTTIPMNPVIDYVILRPIKRWECSGAFIPIRKGKALFLFFPQTSLKLTYSEKYDGYSSLAKWTPAIFNDPSHSRSVGNLQSEKFNLVVHGQFW